MKLRVEGVSCAACAPAVRSALAKLHGVRDTNVDAAEKTVSVEYEEGTVTPDEMIRALTQIGFPAELTSESAPSPSEPPSARSTGESRPDPASCSALPQRTWAEIPPAPLGFFEVALVCPAAPAIGCGSRSRPVLAGLARHPGIEGAWLNREGTRIAIAWRSPEQILTQGELNRLLATYDLTPAALADDEQVGPASSVVGAAWYDAESVSRLSDEEAGVVATRLTNRLAARTDLCADQCDRVHADVEHAFRSYFREESCCDVEAQLASTAERYLEPTQLDAFKAVLALGYCALPEES